jgi:hypothetical protein
VGLGEMGEVDGWMERTHGDDATISRGLVINAMGYVRRQWVGRRS